MAAYYCFVDFGWPPSKYEQLPLRERVLISVFLKKHMKERNNLFKGLGVK